MYSHATTHGRTRVAARDGRIGAGARAVPDRHGVTVRVRAYRVAARHRCVRQFAGRQMEPSKRADAAARAALGGSVDGLSDEVVELLIAMKSASAVAARQEVVTPVADDPPGFWTTSSDSESELDDGVQANSTGDGANGEGFTHAAARQPVVTTADDPPGLPTFSDSESEQDKGGCDAVQSGPPAAAGTGDHSRDGSPAPAPRQSNGKPTVEAQLNRRRRMQRMAAPSADSAFATSHPQLWLALQVGLDANGCIDSKRWSAETFALPGHGSIAETPLGERLTSARSAVPFELESELDLGALVSPSHWAPAPVTKGTTPMQQVCADLAPLLYYAKRAVQFAHNGALRSAALTLQTVTDNIFINCERYGPYSDRVIATHTCLIHAAALRTS